MPKPKDFRGRAILKYGYCSKQGEYTKKDLEEVDIINYDTFLDIIEDENGIQIFNLRTKEWEDVDVEECKIGSDTLEVGNKYYVYMKEDDIFMGLNYENINEIIKILSINGKCEHCKNEDEWLMEYYINFWICNSCINNHKEIEYYE